jgi:cell division protein FtsB
MLDKIQTVLHKILQVNAHTLGLIAILAIAISVTYSTAKIIHKNYTLEQEITILRQENSLQEQVNANQKLKNEYYTTDAYLDLAARRYFNRASPGERLVLVPESIAQKFITPIPENLGTENSVKPPTIIQNWRQWLDFFSGKPIDTDA